MPGKPTTILLEAPGKSFDGNRMIVFNTAAVYVDEQVPPNPAAEGDEVATTISTRYVYSGRREKGTMLPIFVDYMTKESK